MGHPKFDPHGDPIPDAEGNFAERQQRLLCEMKTSECGVVVGVNEHSPEFLQYLDRMELVLGTAITIMEIFSYDESIKVRVNSDNEILLSKKVSQNLFVSLSQPSAM